MLDCVFTFSSDFFTTMVSITFSVAISFRVLPQHAGEILKRTLNFYKLLQRQRHTTSCMKTTATFASSG